MTQSVAFSLGTKGVYEPINAFQASVLSLSAYILLAHMSHMTKHKVTETGSTHSPKRKGTTPFTWLSPSTTGVLGSLTLALTPEDFEASDLHCILPNLTHYSLSSPKKADNLLSTIPGSSMGNLTSKVSVLGSLT